MSLWEYKVISSAQQQLTNLSMLESFLNALGREQWEVVSWQIAPGDPLRFEGLARRPAFRDWFPEAAPKAKGAEDAEGKSVASEPEPELDIEEHLMALRPLLQRQGGSGSRSLPLEKLADELDETESELRAELEKLGLRIPARADEPSVRVEAGPDAYWVNQDRRGRLWLNCEGLDQKPARPEPKAEPARAAVRAGSPDERRRELLGQMRPAMKRNRRGPGYSGNLGFLARKLKRDEKDLLAELRILGFAVPQQQGEKTPPVECGGFWFRLNRNQKGEVWMNARERPGEERTPAPEAQPEMPPPARAAEPLEAAAVEAEESLAELLGKLEPFLKKSKGGLRSAPLAELAAESRRTETDLLDRLVRLGLALPANPETKPAAVESGANRYWIALAEDESFHLRSRMVPRRRPRSK